MLKNKVSICVATLMLITLFNAGTLFTTPLPDEKALEKGFQAFWDAGNLKARNRAAKKILKAKPTFQQVWDRLKKGRTYPANAKTGRQTGDRSGFRGVKNLYSFYVPKNYDPSKAYPVTVYLHGGINRPPFKKNERWFRYEESAYHEDRISVFPASWGGALWWRHSQITNVAAILQRIKKEYNVDENRVYMLGFSDGGTGAYYQAFHNTTPWANYMVFIGHLGVLINRDNGVEGYMHTVNLRNRPFLIINCGHDHLYPITSVQPYLELLKETGVDVTFRPKPFWGHTVRWWPEEKENINAFRNSHPRNPYPKQLTWQTDLPNQFGRVHWLKIDKLGKAKGESTLKPYNTILRGPAMPPPGVTFDITVKDKVQVLRVVGKTPAAYAGLQKGDVILLANKREIKVKEDLYEEIKATAKGKSIFLKLLRGNELYRAEIIIPNIKGGKKSFEAFPRPKSSGRVRVRCDGNGITAHTMGVKTFTLLLSPELVDFEKPVEVTVNGKTVYSAKREKNIKTLLKWAAIDLDRTMLFASELKIELQ